ncbi:MAG: hypothetical protein WCS37_01620 [Chloroflexota bacterium]|nr:hypothetical protein [Chloroflexota bacterium]
MGNQINTTNSVDLEKIIRIYCSWLPQSMAPVMYQEVMARHLSSQELALLFGFSVEQCNTLLEGGEVEFASPEDVPIASPYAILTGNSLN